MAEIYWFCGDEQFQPEVLVTHAKLAEQAGFDGVMMSEHFHPWVDDRSAASFAFATLGAMAAVTKALKFMTTVTVPLFRYHPALAAQAAATLERLSNGRFSLGLGTGENLNEGALGFPLPPYAERADRMREALQIITRLLKGEKLDFKGKYYQTEKAKLYSPPVKQVPVYLAAGGPKSAALAGELTDGVITSIKDVKEAEERIYQPAQTAAGDRTLTKVATHWTLLAENDDEAWQALYSWRGLRAPSKMEAIDPATLREEADEMDRSEILSKFPRVRSAQDLIETYTPLVTDLKADIIGIQTMSTNTEQTIRMIGRDVLPELRRL